MKTTLFVLALAVPLAASGAPLSSSTFTEVINEVSILSAATQAATRAEVRDVVEAPDSVRTGANSRAELTAPDQTITRVGANTVFSFTSENRTFELKKGSLLFQSPKGNGGGTIRSGGASAAVLGTTLMVSATPNGGFKVILVEDRGKIILANGKSKRLTAGQVVYILPGGEGFSDVYDIHLGDLVAGSLLINGFSHSLPSDDLIQDAIRKQGKLIAGGGAIDTGQTVDRVFSGGIFRVVDDNTYQGAVPPLPAIPAPPAPAPVMPVVPVVPFVLVPVVPPPSSEMMIENP